MPFARRWAACATTRRISATLLSTALRRSKRAAVAPAITWASVVLPVPGGPNKITEEILSASIRTVAHVTEVAVAGSDCATLPPAIFEALFKHPLTDLGLQQFLSDWAKTGQSIL